MIESFIYFVNRIDNAGVVSTKIGFAGDYNSLINSRLREAIDRPKGLERAGFTKQPWLHSIIRGTQPEEKNIHKMFAALALPGLCEEFYLRGELADYLNYLGAATFSVSSSLNTETTYVVDQRLPFSKPWENQNVMPPMFAMCQNLSMYPLSDLEKRKLMLVAASNEAYTPEKYVNYARQVMGSIDLDPATSPTVNALFIKAPRIFTANEDGIKQQWCGNVFCNPPYGGH